MQRQIKFRAWDGKEMHLPEYADEATFFIMPDGEIRFKKEEGYNRYPLTWQRKDWVLMQFTGLKDRHGKEIYEDDILRINDRQMQVVFQNGCFYTSTSTSKYRLGGWALEAVGIIGNIYQHPDLIPVPATGNG